MNVKALAREEAREMREAEEILRRRLERIRQAKRRYGIREELIDRLRGADALVSTSVNNPNGNAGGAGNN
jgi:hypothetical protein